MGEKLHILECNNDNMDHKMALYDNIVILINDIFSSNINDNNAVGNNNEVIGDKEL